MKNFAALARHFVNALTNEKSGDQRQACSADFQSAVSRISNPQAARMADAFESVDALPKSRARPTGSRRYSRLETCATTEADAPQAIRERNS